MPTFEPACLALAPASLPLTDARAACTLLLRSFPAIPSWPQLPRLSRYEDMYLQFSGGLPGLIVDDDGYRVDLQQVDQGLERLYLAYLDDEAGPFGGIGEANAEGLAMLLSMRINTTEVVAVKGHLTGPISLGLHLVDNRGRPILQDEVLADAAAKLLRLKAAWQERQLRRFCPQSLIVIHEPCLGDYPPGELPARRDVVLAGLEEVFAGISGLKGLHCCGSPDWSLLLATSVQVVSFDAYHCTPCFAGYAPDVKTYLRRGGIIAWGIIPADAQALESETVESLSRKLDAALDLLVGQGVRRDDLLHRALITTSCGLGELPPAAAVRACELTAGLSARLRASSPAGRSL